MDLIEKILNIPYPAELGYVGIFGPLVQIHIVVGLISLAAGGFLLAKTKGTPLHKQVGLVVVIALMCNFLLAVPLGTLGRLTGGQPANLLTTVGAVYVGVLAFSGFRLARVGADARSWLDKGCLGLQILTAAAYFFLTFLMVAGTSLFGMFVVTSEPKRFVLSDNAFPLTEASVQWLVTTDERVVGMIASENIVPPLLFGSILVWFAVQDWGRITGRRSYSRPEIINQHVPRVLLAFSGSVIAALLNLDWLSVWLNWTLPTVAALGLAAYFHKRTSAPRALVGSEATG